MPLILAAVAACLGAALAYGATNRAAAPQGERLLRPQLIEAPGATVTGDEVQLRFNVPPRTSRAPAPAGEQPTEPRTSTRRFECRLDGGSWSRCASPYRLTGLAPGAHQFAVRVFNREGRPGEPARAAWRQIAAGAADAQGAAGVQGVTPEVRDQGEAQQFSITALKQPEDLYPGLPATEIPVRIANPNPVPIEVTAVSVAVAEGSACGPENFATVPAAIAPAEPLRVPAEGSVDLPTESVQAPSIRMLDLPVNQDHCQGLSISLRFSGEARG